MPLPVPRGHQRDVVNLPGSGHQVVLGTAGSGKTTMAILRAAYLSDPELPEYGRTLLLTFNKRLSSYIRAISGDVLRRVKVENYHKFARGYLKFRGLIGHNEILKGQARLSVVTAAVADTRVAVGNSPLFARSVGFFLDEISWLEKQGISSSVAYREQERVGRAGARVERADRELMWRIYERYRVLRTNAGYRYDFDDIGSAVIAAAAADATPRMYRHIIIDEGQDLGPEMLRSLAQMVPADGSITFFGDVAQQIYGHRLSWRSAGLHPIRVWNFRHNYRNSKEIAALGFAIARMPYYSDVLDMVEPEAPVAAGPKPTLVKVEDGNEIKFIAEQAMRLSRTSSVAILARSVARANELIAAIRPRPIDLRKENQPWVAGPKIAVGTYHSAKGLEFDVVLLPFLSSDEFPDPDHIKDFGLDDAERSDGRLLYVGVTRAKTSLILSYSRAVTNMLPDDADLYVKATR